MSYPQQFKKNTVPVGMTPIPKYTSWDEHREAIRRDVEIRRAAEITHGESKRHQTAL